ncbi:MAG: hypothetical protein Greene041619_715 [Candidatus Peregrinibacteria bacterium Greene0416_19]|nr:MAG: hypothetical protein Greene041619_715 [Candidatus Peregrinibacteria bacterium Greene0416_19]
MIPSFRLYLKSWLHSKAMRKAVERAVRIMREYSHLSLEELQAAVERTEDPEEKTPLGRFLEIKRHMTAFKERYTAADTD